MQEQYQFTNSKGVVYYLRETKITLGDKKEYVAYFFTKTKDFSKGEPCALPADREVVENPRSGLLILRKKRG